MSYTISAKVDDELLARIDDARRGEEPHRESRSACIKRLVLAGLDAEEAAEDAAEEVNEHTVTPPLMLMWAGSVAVAAQYADAAGLLGPAGLLAMLTGYLLTRESIERSVRQYIDSIRDSE